MAITEEAVRDALRQVIDPELGINIVDLGLVYGVAIEEARVRVAMTMTSPACPMGDYLKDLVDFTVKSRIPEIDAIEIDLVFEPPWSAEMMSAEGRQQLDGGQ
jgi:metal-sulfur cluster biosynthetic enzyme